MAAQYKRVMIKLSGEALVGEGAVGFNYDIIDRICKDIVDAYQLGIEICIVVGGGNLYRGSSSKKTGIERASADYIGMMATVMNALVLQNTIEKMGVDTRVLSAITMMSVCEPFIRRRAIRHMERKRIVICAAGTGNPFFTTDTAAALRAIELRCDAMLKATQVDGVYSADPKKDKAATRYEKLSYRDVLTQDLNVMDTSAIALARENKLPILVFSIYTPGTLKDVVCQRGHFTMISEN